MDNSASEDKITDPTLTSVLGSLNQLDSNNVEEQVKVLFSNLQHIPDRQDFIEAVQLIVEEAMNHHKRIGLIVQVCLRLLALRPDCISTKKSSFFRRTLLSLCQIEFEDRRTEVVLPHNPEEKVVVKEKKKYRHLGIILFMGELYIQNLITSSQVIIDIAKALLQDIAYYKSQHDRSNLDQSAELEYNLLSTTGKLLDEQSQFELDTVFHEIKQLQKDNTLSTRSRDLLKEIIKRRLNGWKLDFDNRTKISDKNKVEPEIDVAFQPQNSLTDLVAMKLKVNRHLIVLQDKLLFLLENPNNSSSEYITELKTQRETLHDQIRQIDLLISEKKSQQSNNNSNAALLAGPSNDCVICFSGSVDSVLIPCGHLALCFSCATMVTNTSKKCPLCRQPVKSTLKTFKVAE